MKQTFTVLVALLLVCGHASARDTKLMLPIDEAFESPDYTEKLGDEIKFYFGEQQHPAVEKKIGEYATSKKTNNFHKVDKESCEWVLLSALITLKERAQSVGGDAVVNIRSNYNNNEVSSDTEFECHTGKLMAGVALKGDVVKLK